MTTTRKLTVTVRRHPEHPSTHWRGTVTTARGYVFSCTWADDENGNPPSEEKVLKAWKEDRKAFDAGY